jgi:hypothetical protein
VAVIHQAELSPSKIEALAAWVPRQVWGGGADGLASLGGYRFDDPDGAVGIETLLIRTGDGRLLQVPLTYRAAPLAGAEDALVATMEHSVLGPRWAYDGCADPVCVRAMVTAVLTGGHEAELEYHHSDGIRIRPPTVRVAGSGSAGTAVPALDAITRSDTATATVLEAGPVTLTVRRRLDGPVPAEAQYDLRGTWPGTDEPAVLLTASTVEG